MLENLSPKERAVRMYLNGAPTLSNAIANLEAQEATALRWAAMQIADKCEKPYKKKDFDRETKETTERPVSCYEHGYDGSAFKRDWNEFCEVCRLAYRTRNGIGREYEE
jgi:hypothetical protein